MAAYAAGKRSANARCGTPRPNTLSSYRQVSWLAGLCVSSPSRPSGQWHIEATLSAYSRGGGRGFGSHKGQSWPAFPFHAQRFALFGQPKT